MSKWISLFLIAHMILTESTHASKGDRSKLYNRCLKSCFNNKCENDMKFKENPSIELKLLMWTCKDDCSYSCMWNTVEYFAAQGLEVPQFHGKWPFVRIIGLQEPASVFFSLLNFYVHLKMFKKITRSSRRSAPMFVVWTYFNMVCLMGWIWSAIFHARDKPFTEVMDYSCAFAMVLTLLYSMLLRVTYGSLALFVLITCGYASILYAHLLHLWSGRINYGYNMQLNVILGFLTFSITMVWWYRNRNCLPHAHLIGWFNILTICVTLLEVADFPPIFWIFDAHSLWHASTAPLAILLYRFIIADCFHLRRQYRKQTLDVNRE